MVSVHDKEVTKDSTWEEKVEEEEWKALTRLWLKKGASSLLYGHNNKYRDKDGLGIRT